MFVSLGNIAWGPVIGAGISALGNVVGGLFGNRSQDKTNQTNLQIAREQNDFNLQQWNRERDFAVDMWNMNNAYNTPSAQKSRMLEAGINPYLADIQSGNATAASTPQGAPAAGATMQPKNFDYIGAGVNDAVNQYIQLKTADASIQRMESENKLLDAQAQNVLINNQYQADYWEQQIANFAANTEWTKNRSFSEYQNHTRFNADYRKAVADAQQSELGITAMEYSIGLQAVNFELAKAKLPFADDLAKQEFRNALSVEIMNRAAAGSYNASAVASYASANASNAQAKLFANEAIESAARATGIRIDNTQKALLLPGVLKAQRLANKTAHYQKELARKQNANYNTDKWFNRAGALIGMGSNAAVGFGAGAVGMKTLRGLSAPKPNPIGFR